MTNRNTAIWITHVIMAFVVVGRFISNNDNCISCYMFFFSDCVHRGRLFHRQTLQQLASRANFTSCSDVLLRCVVVLHILGCGSPRLPEQKNNEMSQTNEFTAGQSVFLADTENWKRLKGAGRWCWWKEQFVALPTASFSFSFYSLILSKKTSIKYIMLIKKKKKTLKKYGLSPKKPSEIHLNRILQCWQLKLILTNQVSWKA